MIQSTSHLLLRDRSFEIKLAEIKRHGDLWGIEIETREEQFDGENWSPYLYHQGLRLPAAKVSELRGLSAFWDVQDASDYPHPEIGCMCVFGHHDVRNCKITFGEIVGRTIQLNWDGVCDVYWDELFQEDVPFIANAWQAYVETDYRYSSKGCGLQFRLNLAPFSTEV